MAVQSEHLGSTHPDDGTRLCLIALTERLSHFLVMTFLALHLNERRGYSEAEALSLCGLYGGVVYVSAIGGGWLADRLNQHRRAVQVGGLLLALGYLALAQSWLPIALALAVLTAGHALFKPSLSVLFGRLRGRSGEDQFRLLYLMVNLGAAVAPFVAQSSLSAVGRTAPFYLAAALSVVAVLTRLHADGTTPEAASSDRAASHSKRPLSVLGILVLCLLVVVFFAAFQQTEGALIFWARDRTDRSLFGTEVPTLWLSSLPAVCVLLTAAPLTAFWSQLSRRGLATTPQVKLRAGLLVSALAFGLFAVVAQQLGPFGKAAMVWLVLFNIPMSVAELCVAPVAMAFVHSISPGRRQGLGMGLWFLLVAVGNWLSGQLGGLSTARSGVWSWGMWALLAVALLLSWLLSLFALPESRPSS